MKKLKITTIRKGIQRHVYDLNVPKNHNFFILEKGILTHNCDNLSMSTQMGLRSFIEEYSANCGFILTCNFKQKVIEPLRDSRFSVVDFAITPEERPKLAAQFFKRTIQILKNESVEYDMKTLAAVVEKGFPNFRKILVDLQKYAAMGSINEGIFVDIDSSSLDELFEFLKDKNFTAMRKWCTDNSDQDTTELFRKLYQISTDKVELKSMPGFVVTLAEYSYKHNFVADPEINLVAMLTTIMLECSFK